MRHRVSSAGELGTPEDHRSITDLSSTSLQVHSTPERPDCLSVPMGPCSSGSIHLNEEGSLICALTGCIQNLLLTKGKNASPFSLGPFLSALLTFLRSTSWLPMNLPKLSFSFSLFPCTFSVSEPHPDPFHFWFPRVLSWVSAQQHHSFGLGNGSDFYVIKVPLTTVT